MTSSQSAQDRSGRGRALRKDVPRSSHGDWTPAKNRSDPVSVITGQDSGRVPFLVPVRHARMAESAFAFYRGAAAVMAQDLSTTPSTGVNTQLCGDAHLANFGTFGSAERQLVFDVNDFDETLPGPWEWDVKRMATSFVLAARDNGFGDKVGRATAEQAVCGYRQAMAGFAAAPILDVWYAQLDVDSMRSAVPSKSERKQFDKRVAKTKRNTSQRALSKLTETVDGKLRIKSNPPLLVPLRELAAHMDPDDVQHRVTENYEGYLASLEPARSSILGRFDFIDLALKVVGVGSVGTRCWIALFVGRNHQEPLFLQVKEATDSVLEGYLPHSEYDDHGRRVVEGQRMMQASSDVFLGWHSAKGRPSYYWRLFRDMKGSADVAAMGPDKLGAYARICGWTLAHAHARSGDAVTMSAYMGSSQKFDKAVGEFAVAYARQNDDDFEAFTQAIKDNKIEAREV